MKSIDLNVIAGKQYKVLSGVELGEKAREVFNLDEEDMDDDVVTIKIPEEVYSVNSSFFSGVFQKSIKKLGEKKFRDKYIFECDEIIKLNNPDYNKCKLMIADSQKNIISILKVYNNNIYD